MRPVLPKKPTRDVDKISASWLLRLMDCIEWAMNHPKGDGKTIYRNGETISTIRQSVNAPGNSTTGDSYNGMFKVVKTADNKIKIVDGFADDYTAYTKAGDALINDTLFNDITAVEFTITANSFIYLISTGSTPTIQLFTSKQTYELGKSKTLISRIEFADSKITKASQEVHGPITGFIDGDCAQ